MLLSSGHPEAGQALRAVGAERLKLLRKPYRPAQLADALREVLVSQLTNPRPERLWYLGDAFRAGMDIEELYRYSGVDPWFLVQIKESVDFEEELAGAKN